MERRIFLQVIAGSATGSRLGHLRVPEQTNPAEDPYLDAHTHVNSVRLADVVESQAKKRVVQPIDGAELVRRMDPAGTKKAIVLSTAYMMASDAFPRGITEAEEHQQVGQENDFAARECARFAERLIPFLSLNPKRSYAIHEIDRCVDELGMQGLKLHFWNSLVDVRDPAQRERVRSVIEHAASRGLPVVAHVFVGAIENFGPTDVEKLVFEVVEPLRSLRFCFAHLGGAGRFDSQVQAVFAKLIDICGPSTGLAHRVFADMAAVLFGLETERTKATPEADQKRMGELLRAWGLDRIFWGSDTIPDYLAQTRAGWPLTSQEWKTVCSHRGRGFLSL